MKLPRRADGRPRVVIVGAGFAGFHCARVLDRRLAAAAEVVLVNPGDHMVYSALLPDVVGGMVDPACVATPLIDERYATIRAEASGRGELERSRVALDPPAEDASTAS